MKKKYLEEDIYNSKIALSVALGYIIEKLYPHAFVGAYGITDTGFYMDINVDKDLSVDIKAIDEALLSFVSNEKGSEINFFEMIPANAISFLKSKKYKNKFLLEKLSIEKNNLVSLANLDDYYQKVENAAKCNLNDFKNFKIYDYRKFDGKIRLYVAIFKDQKELKRYLKKICLYKKNNHEIIGKKLGLFADFYDDIIWLEKGLIVCENFLNFIRNFLNDHGFRNISLTNDKRDSLAFLYEKKYVNVSKDRKFFEINLINNAKPKENKTFDFGLFNSQKTVSFHEYKIVEKSNLLDEIIDHIKLFLKLFSYFNIPYSIKFYKNKFFDIEKVIENISNINDFCHNKIIFEKESKEKFLVEFFFEDGRGFSLTNGPYIKLDFFEKNSNYLIFSSILNNFYYFVAIFLETLNEKELKLPFFLSKELVWIINIDKKSIEYSKNFYEICDNLDVKVKKFTLSKEKLLKDFIKDAYVQNINFVVVIGEKECKEDMLSIKNTETNERYMMKKNLFIDILKNLKKKGNLGLDFENKL